MDGFPCAFYLCRLEDVLNNPNVLFRLVKPTAPTKIQKFGGVESAGGLVNVIPQRRIYRMETTQEIDIFKRELLKRPLVIQAVSHSGLGCGSGALGCGLAVDDQNYVLLINQTHPKVLSRIQMGADAAMKAMERGSPFLLRYRFGTLLQRLHTHLFDASGPQYVEWEYCELVVRFPGKKHRKINPATALVGPPCTELNFDFADIQTNEILHVRNELGGLFQGDIIPINAEEIRSYLPGWTVNEVSPLDNIDEEIPETYSYAQAGRLYESFRKKKRQRPKASDSSEPEPERPNRGPTRMRGLRGEGPRDDDIDIDDVETSFIDDGGFGSRDARQNVPRDNKTPVRPGRPHRSERPSEEKERPGLYPDITVVNNSRGRSASNDSREWYNQPAGSGQKFENLHHRDSDRSSHSTGGSSNTGADSGYSGADDDGFGHHGNRRYNDNAYGGKHDVRSRDLDRPRAGSHYNPIEDRYGDRPNMKAHENRGFQYDDDADDIMRKHKEMVTQMQQSKGDGYKPRGDNYRSRGDNHDSRRDHYGYGDNYGQNTDKYGYSRSQDYENRPNRPPRQSRAHSGSRNEDLPPSYGEVTNTRVNSKFNLSGTEPMTESFI